MDILTHALLPYAAALAILGLHRRALAEDRRPLALAFAAGLGGAAPDFDGALSWAAKTWDAAYFLQHRGVSHTLLGAPLFALAAIAAASLLWRWKPARFPLLRPTTGMLVAAILGSWSHLALDMLTLSGVPWLWPFGWERASLELYHWLVWWLFPVSGVILLLRAWKRLSPRGVVRAASLVVVALVLVAGVRLATRPDLAQDETAFPRSSELEWTIVRALPDGSYEASLHRLGARSDAMRFTPSAPAAAAQAIARAEAHDSYRGWRMETYGPLMVNATPAGGGAWRVEFVDVAARYEALHDPSWTPTEPFDAWGVVAFLVDGERIEVTKRGW